MVSSLLFVALENRGHLESDQYTASSMDDALAIQQSAIVNPAGQDAKPVLILLFLE